MEGIKMKDSGIKWIGKIPEDWDIKKIKYCCDTIGSGTTPDSANLEYYENGIYNWIQSGDLYQTEYIEKTEKKITQKAVKDSMSLKLYKKDFLVIAMYGASVGNVAISKINGYVNQACCALNSKNNNIKYIFYNIKAANKYLIDMAFGGTQPNISQIIIKNTPIVLPSRKEQDKIVNFLDKKCADIDEIISKTEKQIEILEQYKKSLITETVTKGLKNSKLINSDIKWIGEIPFDWNTKKIKYVATLKGRIGWQGLTSDEYQDEGPYLITGVDFLNGQINWENCVHIPEKRWTEAVDIRIKENDLLITKDGTVGKVALVKNLKDKASLNSGVLLINLEEEYDKKYLFWVLQSDIFWKWFSYTNSGNSTIIHLYQHDFDNFEYPIPPMKEQKEIAAFLDMKCDKTDKIIKQQKASLETLKKYKQSLIYEYVTGKKRV